MAKQKKNKESFNDFLEELQRNTVSSSKSVETIEERKYFLIVCEGERTEPLYFNHLKSFLPKHLVETIHVIGEGDNTINIVNKAIQERDKRKADILNPDFDEVWAVFDKDDFPQERYNEAVYLAGRSNIESGHSNQAFELWYVLHFQFPQTALHRRDYFEILSRILKMKYAKNDSKVVAELLSKGNVRQAIEWARALEQMHEGETPSNCFPSTRVYILVERLLAYTRHDA